jgi:hypothetical protein
MTAPKGSGGCLCGAVRYVIDGELRDVILCHCRECLRWHGHFCAATSCRQDDLRFTESRGLRWIDSPGSDAHARRGFCGECGSSLFWDAPDRATVAVAAGTLDEPTGLRVVGQIYTSQAGDYYTVPADVQPQHELAQPAEERWS